MAGTSIMLTDEGRRRQSSNFFDILTDPQKYQEQVKNFVNENFQDDEDDSGKRQIRKQSEVITLE